MIARKSSKPREQNMTVSNLTIRDHTVPDTYETSGEVFYDSAVCDTLPRVVEGTQMAVYTLPRKLHQPDPNLTTGVYDVNAHRDYEDSSRTDLETERPTSRQNSEESSSSPSELSLDERLYDGVDCYWDPRAKAARTSITSNLSGFDNLQEWIGDDPVYDLCTMNNEDQSKQETVCNAPCYEMPVSANITEEHV